MSFKEILDTILAVGTLLAAWFAARSAREATSAIKLQREAIRAETFISLLTYERDIHFSQNMDVIRALSPEECKNYKLFRKKQSEKDEQIRQVVDFLNHLAHLIRHGYVTPRHILALYTSSIMACRTGLLGKGNWLDGFRVYANSPAYYLNFEYLCNNLENLWLGKEVAWPNPQFQALDEMRP